MTRHAVVPLLVVMLPWSQAPARIAELLDRPSGWIIPIKDDPFWFESLHGQAVFGASAILARTIPGLFQLAPEPLGHRLQSPGRSSATGTLTVICDPMRSRCRRSRSG